VRVSAVIDMNSVSTVVETYDPRGKVAKKEESTEKTEPVPGSTPAGAGPTVAVAQKKDTSDITEYEIGKTVKQETILPGEIKSLSVAAFVDLSAPDANEAGSGSSATMPDANDVEQIIRNALGLRPTDSLKVVNVPFHRPAELFIEDAPSNWPRYTAIARHVSLGIMAICALLVLRIFRGAKKKALPTVEASQLPAPEGAIGFLPSGQQASESLVLRRQIANTLQSNPEQVRQLFSSWLSEKE
jgi:flagellar biosynthesis/type III secretory pathway M-ring protein FliF/YscJ